MKKKLHLLLRLIVVHLNLVLMWPTKTQVREAQIQRTVITPSMICVVASTQIKNHLQVVWESENVVAKKFLNGKGENVVTEIE